MIYVMILLHFAVFVACVAYFRCKDLSVRLDELETRFNNTEIDV